MRHIVAHVLENQQQGNLIATGCLQQFFVGSPEVEPGHFVDDDGAQGWCPRCLAIVQGREADQRLPPEVGVTEQDGELGGYETDGELGELELEEGGDPFMDSPPDEDR